MIQSTIQIQTGAKIYHLRLQRRVQPTTMCIAQYSDSCSSCSVLQLAVNVQCRGQASRTWTLEVVQLQRSPWMIQTTRCCQKRERSPTTPPVARASVLCVASWSRFLWKLRSAAAGVVARTPTIPPMFGLRCLASLCGRPSPVT